MNLGETGAFTSKREKIWTVDTRKRGGVGKAVRLPEGPSSPNAVAVRWRREQDGVTQAATLAMARWGKPVSRLLNR